jgi:hypothetical protein
METQFRQNKKGRWVLCGPVSELLPGKIIRVKRPDGTFSREVVNSVGKSFTVHTTTVNGSKGTLCCYGYFNDPDYGPDAKAKCVACAAPGASYLRRDTTGVPGKVCAACACLAGWDLKFK